MGTSPTGKASTRGHPLVERMARLAAKAEEGGIWVSDQAKEYVEQSGRHDKIQWIKKANQELKGFKGELFTLWSVGS